MIILLKLLLRESTDMQRSFDEELLEFAEEIVERYVEYNDLSAPNKSRLAASCNDVEVRKLPLFCGTVNPSDRRVVIFYAGDYMIQLDFNDLGCLRYAQHYYLRPLCPN